MTPRALTARGVCVALGGKRILDGVDAEIAPGRLLAIVGPNGAGKSTLLRVLSGELSPDSGEVALNGRPMSQWSTGELALQRAVLPQSPELAFSFDTWDVVALGRHPHRRRASAAHDQAAIAGAMGEADVARFAGRDYRTLSGGEAHRAHYARTLAQLWQPLEDGRARFLLLDEPVASLDLFHQHAILASALKMARAGAGVAAILHDLNLASAFADEILVLHRGRVVGSGAPQKIITAECVSRVWRVGCEVAARGADGRPHVVVHVRERAPEAAE